MACPVLTVIWKLVRLNLLLVLKGVNYLDGTRTAIKENLELTARGGLPVFHLSPSGDFIIYFDPGSKQYYSYEIAKGIDRNLSKETHSTWVRGHESDGSWSSPYAPWSGFD